MKLEVLACRIVCTELSQYSCFAVLFWLERLYLALQLLFLIIFTYKSSRQDTTAFAKLAPRWTRMVVLVGQTSFSRHSDDSCTDTVVNVTLGLFCHDANLLHHVSQCLDTSGRFSYQHWSLALPSRQSRRGN